MSVRTLGALMVGVLLVPVIVSSGQPNAAAALGAPAQATPPRDRPSTEAPTGTARIRGRVVAADSETPLRRAQVRAVAVTIRITRLTSTDAEGRCEFTNLPARADGSNVDSDGQFHIPSVYARVVFRTGALPPPGEYIGLAVKGVQPGEEWYPDLRKRIEEFGKRFTLKEGETLHLEMPYVE